MKSPTQYLLPLLALGSLATPYAAQGTQKIPPYAERTVPLECQVEGMEDDNFRYLAAQCWLPPSGKIRGILCVVLHPDGANGRVLAESYEWEKLAAAYDCALIGVSIVEPIDPTKHWFSASLGSGRALLEAIDRLAQASGRPELTNAPLALAGVCAAGQFAYEFAAFAPKRTSCFVTIGGAKHDLTLAGDAARVPALLVVTPDRGTVAAANLEGLNLWGHMLAARWNFITGNIVSYDAGDCQTQIKEFLEAQMVPRQPNHVAQASRLLRSGQQGSRASHSPFQLPFLTTILSSIFQPPTGHLALSFLGKPLPILTHSTAPADVKITDETPMKKTTFRVQGTKSQNFDEISVPSPLATQVETRRVGESEWQVEISIDSSRIPTGGFNCELPVRFSYRGVPVLGGLQVTLRGTIQRDIYCSPRAVQLSPGSKGEVRLKSRTGTPITGLEIEAILPPSTALRLKKDETKEPLVTLLGAEVPGVSATPIAGYIILRAKSIETQRIKIPFYGSLIE